MEILFEILKIVLPAIIGGLFTKYTYNKNMPLDKLEIAYNRIYHPIYRIIFDKNIGEDINQVINRSKIYITKYNKYIDISTKKIFDELCKCNNETKKKSIYRNFKNIIYDRNTYLRRRLGYLEPNFIQIYKYATPESKSLFRFFMELCVVYISLFSCGITMNRFNIIFNISIAVFAMFILLIIGELIWCLLRFLYYKIRK